MNSGDVDVEDLGYSISDLNKLARAENLLYTPGTEEGANTKDHRGNPVEGAGFDDEWIKRISGENGRYGAGRTMTVLDTSITMTSPMRPVSVTEGDKRCATVTA